eukprot:gene23322-biopygen8562
MKPLIAFDFVPGNGTGVSWLRDKPQKCPQEGAIPEACQDSSDRTESRYTICTSTLNSIGAVLVISPSKSIPLS